MLPLLLQFIETFRNSTLRPSILLLRYNFSPFTKKNVIFVSSLTIILLKIRVTLLMVYGMNMRNRVINRLCLMHISGLRRCKNLWELVIWCIPASNRAWLFIWIGKLSPWYITGFEFFKILNSFCACSASQSFDSEHWIIFIWLLGHYQFI